MNNKKITPAKPRRERSYPQAIRVFSTQAGIHPAKSGISEFVQYNIVRDYIDRYMKVYDMYRKRIVVCIDLETVAPPPTYVLQGVENYLMFNLWCPYEDFLKLEHRLDALVKRHNRNVRKLLNAA